jgi:DNA-binding CsgD family transcriptional regulator
VFKPLLAVSMLVIWVGTVVRLARAGPPRRQQLALLVCVVMPFLAALFTPVGFANVLVLLSLLLVPVAVAVDHEDNQALLAALRAGAHGYLLKAPTVPRSSARSWPLPPARPSTAPPSPGRITDFFTGAHHDRAATVFPELTDRERQVLDLVAAGCGNHDIAGRLGLSEKTVRNHVSAIMGKLRVPDRAAAVAKARDAGLGDANSAGPAGPRR